jgi:hypothetical protein
MQKFPAGVGHGLKTLRKTPRAGGCAGWSNAQARNAARRGMMAEAASRPVNPLAA